MPGILLLVGIACGPNARPAPTRPGDDPSFSAPAEQVKPGMDETSPEPETIRSGDVLGVKMIGRTDLDDPAVPVDRSGLIHLPLVGDVSVGELTTAQAEARVQAALERYDRVSKVSLRLVEARGRIATVTGAVEKPGIVALVGDSRLATVVTSVGGPRMIADGDQLVQLGDMSGAQIVRGGKPLPVDFTLAMRGDPRHNVRVLPGDLIVVPPSVSGRIVVLGNVNKQRTMTFRSGLRLSEALADAGGLAEGADTQDIRVVRGGYANPRLYVANAKALFRGEASDVLLAPGDIVFVSKHWAATAGEVVQRVVPAVAAVALVAALSTR